MAFFVPLRKPQTKPAQCFGDLSLGPNLGSNMAAVLPEHLVEELSGRPGTTLLNIWPCKPCTLAHVSSREVKAILALAPNAFGIQEVFPGTSAADRTKELWGLEVVGLNPEEYEKLNPGITPRLYFFNSTRRLPKMQPLGDELSLYLGWKL